MKSMRLLVVLFLASAATANAQQGGGILLSAVSGSVELQPGPDQAWSAAAAGAELREGTSLRTGPDGRAQITFPDKAVVWVKESSTFGMQSTLPLTRKIQVTQGEVKVSVPHLKRKQTFEVHTTNAVAAVRGTVFSVKTDDKGGIEVLCAFGQVKLHLLAEAKTFSVPQGNGFSKSEGIEAKVVLMNKDQERSVLVDWSPGISNDDRAAGLIKKEESRQSVAEFARQSEAQQNAIAALVSNTKDADFAAGRTMVDVHGNVTRIEQRLLRPGADTLQFINIVSRTEGYTYKDHGPSKPWYNTVSPTAAGTKRLDSLQAFVTFSEKLPQDLVEWPSFFKDHDKITMKSADLVMTNKTGASDILVLGSFGTNCLYATGNAASTCASKGKSGKDEVIGDFYIGTVTDLQDVRDTSKLLLVKDVNGVSDYNADGEDDGVLFAHHASALYIPSLSKDFWMTSETYVINNSGEIQTADSLVNSGKDPFTLLKETAGQIIISLKNTQSNLSPTNSSGTNPNIANSGTIADDVNVAGLNAAGRNIDLVIVPDLMVAMVQKLASSLSESDNSNDN